ncbi:MAG: amidase family protein, partial [Anaerolineae bacterium]|nr:amidase family protein [Anaerolineae bacterium]
LGLLRSAGAQISEVRLPNLDAVSRMHGDIFLVEAAAWHCARHPHDIEAYPQIARTWFDIARTMQVGAYVDACRQRVAMTAQIDAVLADHSAILVPTLPVSRTRKDAATVRAAGRDLDFTMGLVRFTSLFDHTGHPVACFPVKGHPDPLAAGMQLVGRRMDESRLMDIAALLA